MITKVTGLRRLAFGVTAVVVGGVAVLPAFVGSASALQVEDRYIKMSSASNTATNVSYEIGFEVKTAGAVQAVIVDFCSNSPIIGTACTAPTGFTVGAATTTGSIAGMTGTWSGASANSGRTLNLSLGTPGGSAAANAAATFTLTTATNPTSAAGTFYARIFTFTSAANATTWLGTADGSATATTVDSGGVALSTAATINVSATVQEQLTFCVSKTAPATGCTSLTAPDVVLGTGSPRVLTTGAVQTDTAYHQVTTNAATGVVVRLKNTSSTTCAGLSRDNGATCNIAANGAFGTIANSAGLFGLNVANGTGGTGTVTADSDYGTTAGSYGMATATYGTYGDPISSSTSATTDVNSLLTYAANAAPTTPAGIYTATHSLIATGTF